MAKKQFMDTKPALDRVWKNKSIRSWGGVVLLSLLLFVVTDFLMPITYTYIASDDRFLASYLAGYWSGTPEASLPFINPIFAGAVSALYRMAPDIYWYANLHVGVLFLSYVLIARCIFVVAKRAGVNWWIALAVNLAIFGSAFCYNVTWLSFTLTPALSCSAAAAIILCGSYKEHRWVVDSILCIVLVSLAYVWRSSSALVGVCFCTGALVYRIIQIWLGVEGDWKKAYIKMGGTLVVTVALLVVCMSAMSAHKNSPALEEYYDFRASCTQYLDYPGATRYTDDPELYDEVGVSEPLENLINHWFFMDDVIDADLLNTIAGVEDPDQIESFLDFHQTPTQAIKTACDLFVNDRNARLLLYPSVLAVLIGLCLFLRNRKERWLEFFILICLSLGAGILCLYLCLVGRFPIRTFAVIAAPHLVLSLLLDAKMLMVKDENEAQSRMTKGICAVLLVLIVAAAGATTAITTLSSYERGAKHNCMDESSAMDQIAIQNPDNIYIFDFLLAMSSEAYPDYSAGRPTNLFYWGGSYLGTDAFDRQMALNGIENFDASLFLQNNVYFLTKESMNEIEPLMEYMMMEYGVIVCERVDTLAGGLISVYQFHADFDKDGYTGWYESHGNKVYYIDGEAQSGIFKVNGKTYYGRPYEPGANYKVAIEDAINEKKLFACNLYAVAKGLVCDEYGDFRYFDTDYNMVTGWVKYYDSWMYFGRDGVRYEDCMLTEDGITYIFDQDGNVIGVVANEPPSSIKK